MGLYINARCENYVVIDREIQQFYNNNIKYFNNNLFTDLDSFIYYCCDYVLNKYDLIDIYDCQENMELLKKFANTDNIIIETNIFKFKEAFKLLLDRYLTDMLYIYHTDKKEFTDDVFTIYENKDNKND